MHICFAHFNMNYVEMPGGVEKVTTLFANDLVQRGHEVTILYLGDTEGHSYFSLDKKVKEINVLFKDEKQEVEKKLPLGLRIKREIARVFSQTKAQEINAIHKGKAYGKRIKEVLDEIKPDIILSCSVPSTKYVIDDAKSTIPLITMFHGDPSIDFDRMSEVEKAATAKGKALQIILPEGLETAKRIFPDLTIRVIGNTVKMVDEKDRVDLSKEKDTYTLLCVGNVITRKNQKRLVQAFEKIIKTGKFDNWNLEFYGDDGNKYAKELAAYIPKHHLEDRIFIKGLTKEIDKVYPRCDIFATCSRSESFCLSLAEAMTNGLPAIGLKSCSGVNDLIEDGKTGFLVEDTVEGVEEALLKLMEDKDLRVRMGQEGAESIQRFAPKKVYDQWEELIHEVLNKEN